MATGFRPDIQGIRAVAVLLVALDHAQVGPFHGGFVGVDVFFVVSGFLITGLLLRESQHTGRISLVDFYSRRARRILPAATVVLLVTVLASVVLLSGVRALAAIQDAVWVVFFAGNVKFARDGTDYFQGDAAPSPFQHYWSLGVEEQFYLVWPLLLLGLCLLARREKVGRWAAVAILGVVLASFAWSVVDTRISPVTAYFSFFTRAWELGLGALAACWRPDRTRLTRRARAGLSWLGLAAIGFAAVTYGPETEFPGAAAAVPVVGTCLLLVAGIPDEREPGMVQRLISVPPLRIVGDWSYSFYLWHWPALVIVAAVWRPVSGWSGLAVLAGALALSGVTYNVVENPARRAGLLSRGRRRGLLLYPAVLVVVLPLLLVAHQSVFRLDSGGGPAITTEDFGAASDEPTPDFSTSAPVALVEASALAARNGLPVPTDLRPDPLDLDERRAVVGDCDYTNDASTDLCPYGDPDGSRTMVLIGDSHARQWIPALDQIARAQGYRAYWLVKAGCPGADVTPWLVRGGPSTGCESFQDWSRSVVADLEPDLTILASEADPDLGYVEDGTGTHVTETAASLETFEQGVARVVETVSASSGEVVWIGDPPATVIQGPDCLSERDATLADCMSPEDPLVDRFIRAARSGAVGAGAAYIDPSPWFCVDRACPAVVGRYVTRRDLAHVTVEYAEYLGPALDEAMTRARDDRPGPVTGS